jgi:hypothetical protein
MKHRPKPERRRALELLAASPDGCTEALLLANDFAIEMLLDLLRAGLVSASPERMMVDDKLKWPASGLRRKGGGRSRG